MRRLILFNFLFLLLVRPVFASEIKLRGYASFVGGMTLDSGDEMLGYDDSIDFKNGTLLALQVDADLDENLSTTLQFISRGNQDFDTTVKWGYLTYKFGDSKQISLGRMRLPVYRYSDFIDVRYTYNWVETPRTVYAFKFPGHDGLSFVSKDSLGDWDSTAQIAFGNYQGLAEEYEVDFNQILALSWNMEYDGWFSFRVNYFDTKKVTVEVPELNAVGIGINALGSAFMVDTSNLTEVLRLNEDPGIFTGLALSVERENLRFVSEFVKHSIDDSLIDETIAYYVHLGYQFGKFTPNYTFSKIEAKANSRALSMIPVEIAGIPLEVAPGLFQTLPEIVQGSLDFSSEDTTMHEVGLRYDFHDSAALKFSYTQEKPKVGDKVGLLRFSVDLVF